MQAGRMHGSECAPTASSAQLPIALAACGDDSHIHLNTNRAARARWQGVQRLRYRVRRRSHRHGRRVSGSSFTVSTCSRSEGDRRTRDRRQLPLSKARRVTIVPGTVRIATTITAIEVITSTQLPTSFRRAERRRQLERSTVAGRWSSFFPADLQRRCIGVLIVSGTAARRSAIDGHAVRLGAVPRLASA